MATGDDRRLSALPSRRARVLAFLAILLAGGCGALIGASFVNLQCEDCDVATGAGAVVGGLIAAAGVAVVSVLVLRAMGEWRRIELHEEQETTSGEPGGKAP